VRLKGKIRKTLLKAPALILGVAGVVFLMMILVPIALYERDSRQNYPSLISPVVERESDIDFGEIDYTQASNWFVGGIGEEDFISSGVSFFTLSIPKLKIEEAAVAIGGEDLSENLIQYPGTALPGKVGNTVIFGHSVLPQFFDADNYLTIFSTLPTLKKGDDVYIDYDGISYRYRVEDIFEVLPTNLQVLEQNSSGSYLSLITCVPPGHPLKPKRLVIRAKIVPLEATDSF
jgi:LPXTG-site transpeptidase (sortase) family protein